MTGTKHSVLIWWLDQRACEAIDKDPVIDLFPAYLRKQFASRIRARFFMSRRLWADSRFGDVEVNPWPDPEGPLARYLARHCGGIVIEATDVEMVRQLPGVLTDLQLRRV